MKTKYKHQPLSGEGAAISPGRWNADGQKVLYTAENLSLAILEVLVHLDGPPFADHVWFEYEFDASLMTEYNEQNLPAGWGDVPAGVSRIAGSAWFLGQNHVVLSVPSVVVRRERNYLFNTQHPNFLQSIRIIKGPQSVVFDPRLLALLRA